MSARQTCNGRKFGEQGRAAVDVLHAAGVTGYEFSKGKHAKVSFDLDGTPVSYGFACSPRSAGGSAKTVRRELSGIINRIRTREAVAVAEPEEKKAAKVQPQPPLEKSKMLQEKIIEAPANGKDKPSAHPLFSDANVSLARRSRAWLADRIAAAQKLPLTDLTSEVVNVTPALAEIILLEHNDGNRAIRTKRVQEWVDIINEGRVKLVSQGISFSREGKLNNGQHRLSAIVAAGRPVRLNVSFGEDRNCFDVIDSGALRNGSDALKIAGYKNTSRLSAAVKAYLVIKGEVNTNSSVANDVIRATVDKYPGLADEATNAGNLISNLRFPSGPTIAALYIIASESRHSQRLGEFIQRLEDGADLGKGSPILVLREGLFRKAIGANYSFGNRNSAVAAAIVRAWNLWTKNRVGSVSKIASWHPGQPFPEVE